MGELEQGWTHIWYASHPLVHMLPSPVELMKHKFRNKVVQDFKIVKAEH